MSKSQNPTITELLQEAGREIPAAAQDDRGLRLVLDKRKDKLRGTSTSSPDVSVATTSLDAVGRDYRRCS